MDNLPNDLADVLKILHEWQPMHTDGHLVSIPGNVPLLNLRLSLPHDINAFPFSKYASRHIRDHRLGITQEPLRLPFLPKHSALDNRDSLDIFTLILSYMFERRLNEDRRTIIGDYIIQKGLSVESLRDEIYIQLVNQTIGQGSASSSDSAWLLLASCLSTFAPSTVLAKHLLKYVSDDGVDGFDAVCQHKLLQCFGLEPELSRSYPPCLLEWTTNKKKAAMALYAAFSDGEQGVCQVESWTTGEQLAINMFRSRHLTDDLKGWSVQLRDDVDTYECAGYDYVLDLISEMELPPSFPSLTAYFLTMTDISRPASTTRRHWPDEPHNAEKLRLMPLEVDELSDQPVAVLPTPVPLPLTPPPPSPTPAPPPKRISFVEEPPKQPEDLYQKTEGAMSQGSALNKRKDRVPDELSKTSVLNSRYAQGHTLADTTKAPELARPNPAAQQPTRQPKQRQQQQQVAAPPVVADNPPARRRPRPQQQQQQQQAPQKPAGEEDMSAWLDSVFREALSGGAGGGPGQGLANPQAVSRNMKGGEDNLQAQYALVGGVNGVYGLNAFGIQAAPAAPVMGASAPSVYPSSMMGHQPTALSQLSTGMPTVMTQTAMPPALPVVVDPAVQLMQQQQFIQQQQQQQQQQLQQQQQQQQQLLQHLRLQHQQQIQMHQHAADLQVQLQTKELEKQVLQSTIHAEMLKQQLQHLQDSQQPQPQKHQQQQHQQQQRPQTPQLQHQPQQQQTSQQQQLQQMQQLQQLQQLQQMQQSQQHQHQQRPQSTSSVNVAMRHSGAADDHATRPIRPVSGSYIHTAAPEPTLNRQRVPGEVDESRPGGVQTLKRSYLTKNSSLEPRPLPIPNGQKQVTVVVSQNKGRPVRFVDEEREESSDEEERAAPAHAPPAPPRPPSPPIVKKETKAAAAPALKKQSVVNQTKSQPAAQVIKPASAVIVTKTVVTRPVVVNSAPETNGEVDEGPRKAPGKIGIKWPPEPEKTEKQPIPVNRLLITETKEEKMAIRRGQSSEEVQQKINNRIRSSQQAAERDDSPPPLPPPARRPLPPLAATKAAEVQMEEAGTQVQTWNRIDMATKKKELETMLKGVQWGTQNKKDSPVAAPQPERQPPPVAHHESQSAYDLSRLDNIRTVLHAQSAGPYYAYKNVPWSLEIRKEVFSPSENLNNPTLVNLVFAQIVTDVLSGDSIRITQDDKRKMKKLLDTHGINQRNVGTGHSTQVKKSVIKAAKELPIFFARIFPVNGGSKQSRVQMVAVSHSGVRLLARHKDVFDDYIIVFEQIKFSDVIDVHVPKSSTILMRLTGRNVVLYTKYATQLCSMLTSYRQEHSEIIPKIRINDNEDDDD